jgi:hypothetical protein
LIFFSYLRDLRAFVVNISSSYTLRLSAFAGDTPDSLVAANTSGRAKKAHAFARVEDVALCPSQDVGLAVIHGTSQANPIQKLVLTGISNQLWIETSPLPVLAAFQFRQSQAVGFNVWP